MKKSFLFLGTSVFASAAVGSSDSQSLQQVLQLNKGHYEEVPREYQAVQGLFQQTEEETDDGSFDIFEEKFGLKPGMTWQSVIDSLHQLNAANSNIYKLMFLARHGEGFHNIAPSLYNSTEWTCTYQMKTGNEDMEWYDAMLTENGNQQISQLAEFWHQQINDYSAPQPESFYVSPLRRTLQTFNYTWNGIIDENTVPMVKELARETYGIGTESKRHSKQYITSRWPRMKFESGFREDDTLWQQDLHETHQHREFRARLLLNDIFLNDSNQVISITAHSGLIKSLLKVANHRHWNLKTGEVIPVLIKASDFGRMDPPVLDEPWHQLPSSCTI